MARIHGDQQDLLPTPSPPPSSEELFGGKYEPLIVDEDNTPQDFTLTVTYPRTGVGAIVTCVRIKIVQV